MEARNAEGTVGLERPVRSELPSERQFRNKNLEAVYKLVEADAIYHLPPASFREGKKGLGVNPKKALEVLPTLPTFRRPEATAENEAGIKDEELKQKAIHAYKVVVKSFVDHKVITPELALQVARLIKPNEIVINNDEQSEFLYQGFQFPQSEAEKAGFIVSTKPIQSYSNRIKETAVKVGVPMTDAQIESAALCEVIAHEYGHAIETAIMLSRIEQSSGRIASQEIPVKSSEEEKLRKQRNFRSVTSDMNKQLSRLVSDPQLDLPESDPLTPQYSAKVLYSDWARSSHPINRERVGSGFEYLGLRLALITLGLKPEQSSVIVRNIKGDVRAEFDELVLTDNFIKSRGMSITKIYDAMTELYNLDEISSAKLQDRIPLRAHFPVGYVKPLSEGQLTQYVKTTSPY